MRKHARAWLEKHEDTCGRHDCIDLIVGLTACSHEESNADAFKSIRYEVIPEKRYAHFHPLKRVGPFGPDRFAVLVEGSDAARGT